MAKFAPVDTLDGGLDYIDGSNYMSVCSTQPTTYTEAYTTYMLARVAMAAGDIVIAADVNGQKATMGEKLAVAITNSGSALHVALMDTSGSTLRYVTTCTYQYLTSGGTVDIPAWKVNCTVPT